MNLNAMQELSHSAFALAAALSILVLAIFALNAFLGRHRQPAPATWTVTCFYCSQTATVPQRHMKYAFLCPHCQAFNRFDKDGEFVHISAYRSEECNQDPTQFRPQSDANGSHPSFIGAPAVTDASGLLCQTCLGDQERWLRIISEQDDDEIRNNTPVMYDTICDHCQLKLKQYWHHHLEWYMAGVLALAASPLPAAAPHLETSLNDQVPAHLHEFHLRVSLIATVIPWVYSLLVFLHMFHLVSLPLLPTTLAALADNWTATIPYLCIGASLVVQLFIHNPLYVVFHHHKHQNHHRKLFKKTLFAYRVKCISIQCLVEAAQVFLLTVPCTDTCTRAACFLSIVFTALSYRWTLKHGRTILCSYTDAYAANVKADINDLRAKLGLDPLSDPSNPLSAPASATPSPPLHPHRPAHLSTPITPNSAADQMLHFTLSSPTTPTPATHAPRTNPAFHVPTDAMDPTAIRRPQGFGHNNNFQPAMNARPHVANQYSLPSLSRFAPLAAQKAMVSDTSAWGVAAQSQVAQIQMRNNAQVAHQASMAEAAKRQALQPSGAPGFTAGVVMSDHEEDDDGHVGAGGVGSGWLRRRRGDAMRMGEWADPDAMDVDPPASPVRQPLTRGSGGGGKEAGVLGYGTGLWRGMSAPSAFSGLVDHLRQGGRDGMDVDVNGVSQDKATSVRREAEGSDWLGIDEQVSQMKF